MSLTDVLGNKARPEQATATEAPHIARSANDPHARKYALAALEGECDAVASTSEGERNHRLNAAAFACGQLISCGALGESETIDALTAAAKQAGLGVREIKATLASGLKAGKAQPRDIPEPRARSRSNGHARNGHRAGPPPTDPDDPGGQPPDAPPGVEPQPEAEAEPEAPPMPHDTVVSVIDAWSTEGPLIHEPTGITRLDELTGGGPVYGTRWYLAGAPDAGKTALLVQIGHVYAERGIAVGLLAVDEEAGDIVTRLAQRIGYVRWHCEGRDEDTLARMRDELGKLPIRFYGSEWTIEAASADLARWATQEERSAFLGVDSIQTVECNADITARLAGRELSEVAAVTARVRAIRAVATRHRLIALATSELGRSAYARRKPEEQTRTLASGKWSGAIEYSARVLIGVYNVAGESDLVDLELAKNKHGPRDEHVFLRIDRRSQTLTPVSYDPPPDAARNDERAGAALERVNRDAVTVAEVLIDRPGLTVRQLRSAVRARSGAGHDRVDAAVEALRSAIVCSSGPRGARPMTLDRAELPLPIAALMEASHA